MEISSPVWKGILSASYIFVKNMYWTAMAVNRHYQELRQKLWARNDAHFLQEEKLSRSCFEKNF